MVYLFKIYTFDIDIHSVSISKVFFLLLPYLKLNYLMNTSVLTIYQGICFYKLKGINFFSSNIIDYFSEWLKLNI